MFGEFGYQRRLISDRGLAFSSKAFADFLVGQVIRHVLNAIATPRANGQVETESYHNQCYWASTECESRWDEKLSEAVWGNESLRECEHWILPSTTFVLT